MLTRLCRTEIRTENKKQEHNSETKKEI